MKFLHFPAQTTFVFFLVAWPLKDLGHCSMHLHSFQLVSTQLNYLLVFITDLLKMNRFCSLLCQFVTSFINYSLIINQGLVAFSENGLMIRWWSLGTGWWEKLSRNLVPVQCTKLIFVPPWEGFSPNSSRSSIMASIFAHDKRRNSQVADF